MPLPYEKIMYRAAACSYSFNIIKALIQPLNWNLSYYAPRLPPGGKLSKISDF